MTKPKTNRERGYGPQHRAERRKWERVVASGIATCARCDKPIEPGQPWDLGHNDDRTAWTGPECVPCNRGAGGVNGAKVTNEQKQMTIRDW